MNIDQNTILSFLADAIEQLRTLPILFPRQWSNTRVLHQSESRLRIQQSSRPDFYVLICPSISAVERFTESLSRDSRFQQWFCTHPATTRMIRHIQGDPGRVGRSLLNDYLYLVSELVFDRAHGLEIAGAFLNSLETGKVSVQYFSPVKGLHLDFNSASLPNDFELKRLSDDECGRLIDLRPELMEDEDLPTHRCIIQRVMSISVQEDIPPAHSFREEIREVMTALRLLKSGNACLGSLYRLTERLGQFPIDVAAAIPLVNRRSAGRTYVLNESDLPDLEQIHNRLKGDIPDEVPLAIDRVNSAAERQRPEDQIIDLMIAMEALYGIGDHEAIRYKIRLRAATYLHDSPEDRWKLFRFLGHAYDQRSKVVHGGKPTKGNAAPTDLVDRLLECVRQTIRRRLFDPRKIDATAWDRLALTGSMDAPTPEGEP